MTGSVFCPISTNLTEMLEHLPPLLDLSQIVALLQLSCSETGLISTNSADLTRTPNGSWTYNLILTVPMNRCDKCEGPHQRRELSTSEVITSTALPSTCGERPARLPVSEDSGSMNCSDSVSLRSTTAKPDRQESDRWSLYMETSFVPAAVTARQQSLRSDGLAE